MSQKNNLVSTKMNPPELKVIPFSLKNFLAFEDALLKAARKLNWGENLFASVSKTTQEADRLELDQAIQLGICEGDIMEKKHHFYESPNRTNFGN